MSRPVLVRVHTESGRKMLANCNERVIDAQQTDSLNQIFYKLDIDALTVFHDELDLAPFKVKVRTGGGLAGHNGLRSINQHLGPDFRRVRIGIGHPGHKDRVTGHVLGNYAKAEMDDLASMLAAIGAEAEWLARGDDARFMSELALRMQD